MVIGIDCRALDKFYTVLCIASRRNVHPPVRQALSNNDSCGSIQYHHQEKDKSRLIAGCNQYRRYSVNLTTLAKSIEYHSRCSLAAAWQHVQSASFTLLPLWKYLFGSLFWPYPRRRFTETAQVQLRQKLALSFAHFKNASSRSIILVQCFYSHAANGWKPAHSSYESVRGLREAGFPPGAGLEPSFAF